MNKILIIPSNIKNKIIKNNSQNNITESIKYMTISEFIKNYYFDYDNKTIYYLMNKYNYKYEVALTYIKNLYYIKDNYNYKNNKLIKLSNLKKELINNNLLIYNNLFKDYIKDKEIEVIGFDYLEKLERDTLKKVNSKITYNKEGIYKDKTIYKFKTLEEEVIFICNKIIDLIKSGININDIKLLNVSNDYINTINRIFKLHNIPISNKQKDPIYSTSIGLFFINNINKDITITLELIKTKFNMEDINNLDIYNAIIDIINNYTWINDITTVKDMLIYDLKHTYIKNKRYEQEIEIMDLKNNIFEDDKYYFLINFNQESIPTIYKDEEYITDNIKSDNILKDKIVDINKQERISTINSISRIKNLIITYKKHDKNIKYNISSISENFKINIIDDYNNTYKYSNLFNKLTLTEKLDNMIKYNTKDKDIDILYNNYKSINYMKYNNKFTGIPKEKLVSYLNQNLLLSYSAINNYNRCKFRYYINNILKLSIYENTFMIFIGNLFHYILSISLDKEIDIDYEYDNYISKQNNSFTSSQLFFLNKLKKELITVINEIKKQMEYCNLDKSLYEEEVVIDKSTKDIKITFMGVIDKLLYKDNFDNKIISIIDYKTGNPKIDLNTSIHGINLQLPTYLYLAKNKYNKENISFAGFYLQKILNNEITKDYIHTYEQLLSNNLKLQGYSNENTNILQEFDNNYYNSFVIKSMRTTNNGFSSYSKILNDEQINKLIDLTNNKIDENIKDILDAKFDIDPKKIGDINYGCEYCKLKDICFMKNNDIVNLKEYKNLEFLLDGGDNDD